MSLNFCDLLVLGSDLSGVMTATLLAKRGMNVLILDDDMKDEPVPNLAIGVGSRGFKSLLGKLMIPDSKLQVLHENRVGCQVVFPKNRIDLFSSRPLFLKEIEREFPQERGALEELLTEVDHLRETHLDEALNFFPIIDDKEKKRFIHWLEEFPDETVLSLWDQLSPQLQCLIKVQLRFLSGGTLLDPFVLQLLLFLPPEGMATFSIRGGIRELKKLFFDKLEYFGGLVHPLGDDTYKIVSKRREVREIQMGRYNFPTRCRYLLGNTNIQTFYHEMPTNLFSFFFDRSKKKVASLVPKEERCLIQYHVAREVLPEQMQDNLIYISDPLAPLEGTNYLEFNLTPLMRSETEGLDTLLTIGIHLPAGNGFFSPDSFNQLMNDVEAKMKRLIPFAGSRLRRVFPRLASPGDAPELFPETQEFSTIEKMAQKRISYTPSLFFPPMTTSFQNTFIAGPNLLDWLGMEGKMLSALKAVELIWAKELKTRNT